MVWKVDEHDFSLMGVDQKILSRGSDGELTISYIDDTETQEGFFQVKICFAQKMDAKERLELSVIQEKLATFLCDSLNTFKG